MEKIVVFNNKGQRPKKIYKKTLKKKNHNQHEALSQGKTFVFLCLGEEKFTEKMNDFITKWTH